MLTIDNVYRANYALKGVIRKTDIIRAPKLSDCTELYLKTENLQITGSFKVRGAYYKMSNLSEAEKAKGVVACSAGNHAQGVALAAQKNGIKSVICLPDGAPISKIEATKSYGAEVCLVEGVYDDAYNKALELRDTEGYTFIHPFNDEDVIAGQGTIALELIEQLMEKQGAVQNPKYSEQSFALEFRDNDALVSEGLVKVVPVKNAKAVEEKAEPVQQ